jgi:subtilisin family serine protease
VRFLPAVRVAQSSTIAVLYDTSRLNQVRDGLTSREAAAGARFGREIAFGAIHRTVRILRVDPARVAAVTATLRAQPGVLEAGPLVRKAPMHVSTPYFPNDPYFQGFAVTIAPAAPTNNLPPYYESSGVPGQWDMHAVQMEDAWAYSQSNNGSAFVNPNALGAPAIRLAVIDTGEDTTSPELAGKVVRQRCFVTSPSGSQSTSNFTVDPDGHGTNVTGIAASNLGNGTGYTGAGGNVSLMLYRVFPTPDDNCLNSGSAGSDAQCTADSQDIADALDDAVANGANVVNLSLGGGQCPDDSVEGPAIANAIAHNVIVVAASGNSDGSTPVNVVQTPACDPGVIAVGATGLNDATNPFAEQVASYSEYDSTNPGTWGIVAPGGNPSSDTDADNLHWIGNISTSTPVDAKYAQSIDCGGDYPTGTGTPNCKMLIAGTSMSSPHVAGAAALILSVNASLYGTPSAMKSLLCSTADKLSGQSATEGCGRLNVYRAMAKAVGDPTP